MKRFPDIRGVLGDLAPKEPVYCVYPHVYERSTREFLDGFPGRVMYAVKANNDPRVISTLYDAGVRHFDCASLVEVEQVSLLCPDATCYFMNPVRIDGAANDAYGAYGVRHFMVDHIDAVAPLVAELDPGESVIFARMAVHHASAAENLSTKFGAPPDDIPAILIAIRQAGAEPALAFNVGSGVRSPDAYALALGIAERVLAMTPFPIRLLDVGGGFPRSYPGYPVPPLDRYFDTISELAGKLPLADDGELLAEPGRALAAPGLSALVKVLLRKGDRLYLNDGMYGIFWELRCNGHKRYPVRVYRDGDAHDAESASFRVFGPTCDSLDVLPEPVELPADIRAGDYLEFGTIGAYSLSGRSDFNGFHSNKVVSIDDAAALPPGLATH